MQNKSPFSDCIRKARINDIAEIKAIADANRASLGFIRRGAFIDGMEREWLLVAEVQDQIIGFALYWHRRDQQTTLYDLCVAAEWRKQGVGRALIDALIMEARAQGKTELQLKAVEHLLANGFYQRLGFALIRQFPGKKRVLNVWRIDV